MIADYIKIALKNLKKRKLRSFLTLIGILISIMTIFTLLSLSIGLNNAVQEQFRQLGSDKFFIQPRGQLGAPGTGGAVELSEQDVKVIEKTSGVKSVSFNTIGNVKIDFSSESRYTMVVGVPMKNSDVFMETGFYKIDSGRFIRQGDSGEVMIGSQYKEAKFFSNEIAVGNKIDINDFQFRVTGILEPIGNPQDDRLVYMPIEDFRKVFPESGERVDQIIVQISEGNDINEVAERVEKNLRKHRDVTEDTQDFSIQTPEELLKSFAIILNILTGFLLGIGAISLLVGGIGIANTMFTSVLERTRDIGIMKSVGAKNSDVLTIFLIEAGLLGLIGGILGILSGMLFSKTIEYVVVNVYATEILKITFPIYLVFGSLAFAFLVGAVSGLIPAYHASTIRPVDALRYE